MRNYVEEVARMKAWLKAELKDRGFERVILGLSGGFDSGLSAFIASDEKCLGKKGVYCVLMPCESSADSIFDASELADRLGLEWRIVSLEEPYKAQLNVLRPLECSPVCRGNIKARLRMITVYALANELKAMVLNTSNLSEIMSGNGTKYGDAAGDIAFFQSYTKTEMYELAKAIGFDKVSPAIFNKTPTADLEPNQTDEGTMGITYKELDTYLRATSWDEINACGSDVKEKVERLIKRSGHKRNPMPTFMK